LGTTTFIPATEQSGGSNFLSMASYDTTQCPALLADTADGTMNTVSPTYLPLRRWSESCRFVGTTAPRESQDELVWYTIIPTCQLESSCHPNLIFHSQLCFRAYKIDQVSISLPYKEESRLVTPRRPDMIPPGHHATELYQTLQGSSTPSTKSFKMQMQL
jgi:hypothetical protein